MTTQDPIITMLSLANGIAKNLRKYNGLNDEVAAQRAAIAQAREAVNEAMDNGGDADSAFRAYKSANNKLDKLIEQHENLRTALPDDMAALRDLIDDLTPEVA